MSPKYLLSRGIVSPLNSLNSKWHSRSLSLISISFCVAFCTPNETLPVYVGSILPQFMIRPWRIEWLVAATIAKRFDGILSSSMLDAIMYSPGFSL